MSLDGMDHFLEDALLLLYKPHIDLPAEDKSAGHRQVAFLRHHPWTTSPRRRRAIAVHRLRSHLAGG